MVYSLGKESPYDTDPRHEVIDGEAWAGVRFLHPDRVDLRATIPGEPVMGQGYPIAPDSAPKKCFGRALSCLRQITHLVIIV